MSYSYSHVKDLIEQLKLMRVELGDMKNRQLTEERLKHLQAALEDNAKQIAGVQQAAADGGQQGAERHAYSFDLAASKVAQKVDDAVRALSEVRRHYVRLFMLFSALTGLATGALLTLVVFDYYPERDFLDSVQTVGLDLACRAKSGIMSN